MRLRIHMYVRLRIHMYVHTRVSYVFTYVYLGDGDKHCCK